jgi:formamidopyrimidine-DNA glycosylase
VPELPEVEVVRMDLAAHVVGARIDRVTVTGLRSVRRQPVAELAAAAEGRTVVDTGRRGKYLLVGLDDGSRLVVHLRMSGQLMLVEGPDATRKLHTHVVFDLADGRQLRFVDPRTFGEVFALAPGASVASLDLLGPEPYGPSAIGAAAFAARLRAKRAHLKPLLMDQRFVAGLGNIYSDEILWRARLRWDRRSDTVPVPAARTLHGAMVEVLAEAVARRGSTLGDDQYVDLFGQPGGFAEVHQVYGREGEPCARCGRPIVRIKVGGRSSYLCPWCQRRPRRTPVAMHHSARAPR